MRRYFTVALALATGFAWGANSQAQSLVGYWEASGTPDATVGTDGTLQDGAGFAPGKFGQGFSFGGPSDYVSVPGGGGLNAATEGTVSMWVKWSGSQDPACCGGTAGNVLARQQNGSFSNNILGLDNTDPGAGRLTWQPYNPGGPVITGATAVGDGTMRHVAVSFSDGYHALYLDGVLQGTSNQTGSLANNPATPLAIGAWNGDGGGYSTSVVDDVAIWNREVSINQIQSLANEANGALGIRDPFSGVTATASSYLGGGFNRQPGNTVDGVGRGTTSPDGNPGQGNGMWLSSGGSTDSDPQITFDLGSVKGIGDMLLYNYNEVNQFTGRGVNQAEVLISNDGSFFTSLGVESFDEAPGNGTNPGQVVPLNTNARFVRLDILSNYNGSQFPNGLNGVDSDYVGLNEVEFFAVPEPTTSLIWSLLAGLTVGLGWRRRK